MISIAFLISTAIAAIFIWIASAAATEIIVLFAILIALESLLLSAILAPWMMKLLLLTIVLHRIHYL